MTTPKFTFIEPEINEVPAGMFCDPETGFCGPIPATNVEAVEKSEADE